MENLNYDPYLEGFIGGLRPEPILLVSEWADEYRFLSQRASSEPGKWHTKRTPYLKEILDTLSAYDSTEEIVFMAGAQIGKSETGNNWIGYVIDHAPGPMLCVQPTVELAKRYSKQRIDTLIEESERLSAKVKTSRERDSGNTVLSKEFIGGILVMTGANSSAGLRSLPARYLFLDEIDAYPADASGEGDPIDLAKARTRTYSRRKIFMTSTPTISGRSKIEKHYNESDQRKYYVPCPHCEHFQTIEWKNIKWDAESPDKVYLVCEQNGCVIDESSKTQMLENGKWIKANLNSEKAGFFINSLYSPLGWYSWREAVRDWLEAKNSQDKLKTFVNTVLGETWKEKGDAPEWRNLYDKREDYKTNTIPKGVELITAGVDVQKDRLEMHIVGWSPNLEKWTIDYRVIPGDTSDLSVSGPWERLRPMISETWEYEGGLLGIKLTGIDSGYNTQTVYDFCRQFPITKVVATKGFDNLQTTIAQPKAVDVNQSGRKIRRGIKVWSIGSSHIKNEIYGHLRLNKPTESEMINGYPQGYCHFPMFDEEFFRQLTAEQVQVRFHKGYRKYEWIKTYERNEVLDTLVIARACASILGIERMKQPVRPNYVIKKDEKIEKSSETVENFNENSQNSEKKPIGTDYSSGKYEVRRKRSSFWENR
ncbi:MAG: Phage terminase large subunit (GpA) [bacterium ADurb.Bin212]|nr:MAG: Phage terminase large subunit (GpA) [bacterium ADurb.Bin212]